MNIEQTLSIPTPPSVNLGFYEHTEPLCVLTNTENSREAEIPLGVYSNLNWEAENSPLVLEEATTWGSKTLPGGGAFYFANHDDGNPTLGHIDREDSTL